MQNNSGRGLTLNEGSQVFSDGDTFQGNADAGIVANSGAYFAATSVVVQNNGSDGSDAIVASDHSTLSLISCAITGNTGNGVRLQHSAEARFDNYVGPTTVTGNGGSGVSVGDLSFALSGPSSIAGNLGGPDVLCTPQFSATRGALTNIDLEARTVTLKDREESIGYDILVLAVGGVTNYAGVEGAAAHTIPFRKIADADKLRSVMVDALDRVPPDLPPQDTQRALTFAVVGAGASGVELSTKMADLLRDAFKRRALRGEPRVLVIEMGDKIVPGMGGQIRDFVEDAL